MAKLYSPFAIPTSFPTRFPFASLLGGALLRLATIVVLLLLAGPSTAQTTVTINTGVAGTPEHNQGPIYRSTAGSAYDASRYCYLYTQGEMNTAGLQTGSLVTAVAWSKTNTAEANGPAIFRIYMKNTSATSFSQASETWANLNSGATLVYENLAYTIPSTTGYLTFTLDQPFVYTGDALEISTEWDINGVSGNATTGTFDWEWSTVVDRIYGTGNTTLAPITTLSSTTNSISPIDDRRPFIQITHNSTPCTDPPVAGTTMSTSTLVCPSEEFTLSVSGAVIALGQTYQWQVSPDNSSWSNIPGATGLTHTLTQSSANYYRLEITCTQSSTSVPVFVDAQGAPLVGTYTINSGQATGGTNFTNFTDAVNALNCSGISGPVVFNVTASSGPYTEQIMVSTISGASPVNTVTFNGNDETLQFAPVASDRYVINLNGAKHVILDNLNIISTDATYGWGVYLSNEADSNSILNCTIDLSGVTSTTSTNSTGIVASGSNTSNTTTGDNANYLTIDGCEIIGGYYGIRLNGNSTSLDAVGNVITNNIIRDFYFYGVYLFHNDGALVEGNDIHRTNRVTVTTFAGIALSTGCKNVVINANRIHDTHNSASSQTGAAYGIYFTGADAPVGEHNLATNNLIYNFNSGSGIQYGIYNTSSDGAYYYHNSVVLNDPNATDGTTRGFYQTTTASDIEVINNLFAITRGGVGAKHVLHFNTTASTIVSNNNALHINALSGSNHIGYYSGDHTTLMDWQLANGGIYDQNSVETDPVLVDPFNGDLTPSNSAINDIGFNLTAIVPLDFYGVIRSVPPDPGAVEFTPVTNDVGMVAILDPGIECGTDSVKIEGVLINFGTNSQTGFPITLNITGAITTTLNTVYTGTIATGVTDTVTLGYINTLAGGTFNFEAYTGLATDVSVSNDTATLNGIMITAEPPAPTVTDTLINLCIGADTTITASGFSTYEWTNSQGQLVSTDPDLALTNVSASDTFNVLGYALTTESVGITDANSTSFISSAAGWGLFFTVHSSTTIESVHVYPTGTGDITIHVTDLSNNILFSSNVFNLSGDGTIKIQVPVNISLTPGDYKMGMSYNGITNLRRESGGSSFPYVSPSGAVEITAGANGGSSSTTTSYYWFYDWSVTTIGCPSASAEVVVLANPAPVVDLGPDQAFCSGDTFSAMLDAGNPGESFLWSTGETTQTIMISTAGEYSVTVSNIGGCDGIDTVMVTENPTPVVALGMDLEYCAGAGFSDTLDAGNPLSGHLWSTGETTSSIVIDSAGIYWVEVTSPENCVSYDTVMVTEFAPPNVDLGNDTAICQGNPITITLDATNPGATYLWNDGSTNAQLLVTLPGEYSVTVTSGPGCIAEDSITITEISLQDVGISDTSGCVGESITLDAGPSGVYVWSTGASTRTIDVTLDGTYAVTVTYPSGCVATDNASVTFNANPTVTLSDTSACQGTTITLDAGSGPSAYLWNTGETTQTINVTSTATYSVTVTNNDECTAAANADVTIHPLPVITIPDTAACDGTTITLDAGAGAATYLWSTGESTQTIDVTTANSYSVTVTSNDGCSAVDDAAVIIHPLPVVSVSDTAACDGITITLDAGAGAAGYLWSTGATTQTLDVTTGGNYDVTVTSNDGCSASDDASVTIHPLPTVSISDTTACDGITITLDAGSGAASYMWSTGATTQTLDVTTGGNYDVTVTNNDGCSASDDASVTIYPLPSVSIPDTAACDGATIILDAGAGAATYLWSTGESTQTIDVTTANNYSVTVTSNDGCSADDDAVVTIYPLPTVSIPDMSACDGITVTLDAGAGATAYAWSTGETTQTLEVTAAGNYEVTVTSADGCTASDDATVTIHPLPVVDLGADTSVPSNQTVTLDAGNTGADYLWSTGETTQTIEVTVTGSYSVTVTDGNGCEGVDSVMVEIRTGIATLPGWGEAKLFPNPTHDMANLQLDLRAGGNFYIEIFDVAGRNVDSHIEYLTQGVHVIPLDIRNLAQGSYLVRVRTDHAVLGTLPLMKQ